MSRRTDTVSRIHTGLLGVTAVTLVAMIIAYPDQAFTASLSGLTIWWEFVFPALLPFFILSELLLGFGVVHAVGVLLEPLMRILFRLPGAGGWAVAMSFTAGFPTGAKAAADLRRKGAVSRSEGDRLLALSHLCSPIFITSVIAVGFLGHPELGLPLVTVHFLSALLTGILVGRVLYFLARREPAEAQEEAANARNSRHWRIEKKTPTHRGMAKVIHEMTEAHRRDGRPLGRLLGDAVGTAVQALLVIGGFMIVFSVLLQLLTIIGVTDGMRWMIQALLIPWGMPAHLAEGAIMALFEVHLGAYNLSRSGEVSVWGAAMLSSVIAWGGLSVHAQVKSLINGTDLRYGPFLLARVVHAMISMFVTFALWDSLQRWFGKVTPAFAASPSIDVAAENSFWIIWPQWISSAKLLGLFLIAAVCISAMIHLLRRVTAVIRP
jgi:sporulation integral membrane protein YlbJ